MPTPRNQKGQKPTRKAEETVKRLEEKSEAQRGGANKRRTGAQIGEIKGRHR
jgi:hypothetical protein